jgi:hypothetical protein
MRVRNLVLAFAVVAATTSTPAFAATKRAGFNAHASVPGATESTNGDRAAALRDCNTATASMPEHIWGVQIANAYRSCMARRGQPE